LELGSESFDALDELDELDEEELFAASPPCVDVVPATAAARTAEFFVA
jgi:hypothetical protein